MIFLGYSWYLLASYLSDSKDIECIDIYGENPYYSPAILRRGPWVRVPAGSPIRTIDRTFKATFSLFSPA